MNAQLIWWLTFCITAGVFTSAFVLVIWLWRRGHSWATKPRRHNRRRGVQPSRFVLSGSAQRAKHPWIVNDDDYLPLP